MGWRTGQGCRRPPLTSSRIGLHRIMQGSHGSRPGYLSEKEGLRVTEKQSSRGLRKGTYVDKKMVARERERHSTVAVPGRVCLQG